MDLLGSDEQAFAELVESHRRELQVHCYRMLGSFEEAEDLVQETFLRAWRGREGFQGRSTFRAWLYRIATNACLDFLERHPRRPRAREAGRGPDLPPAEIPWLQPYPDRLLEPDTVVTDKETIELAFLVAVQHLPPRQRAVLILRDVLGWSARETADQLESSVDSVKSALKRARSTLRDHLPRRRLDWAPPPVPTARERDLLQRFMDAHEKADPAALAEVLSEDVRLTMPPLPWWFSGRDSVENFAFGPDSPIHLGRWRCVLTWANRHPAVAGYLLPPGESVYRAQTLNVLVIAEGEIAEITAFEPRLLAAFGLPLSFCSDTDPF